MMRRSSLVFVALLMSSEFAVAGQRPLPQTPPGNRIVAQDGDVIVVDNDATVRIVRRRDGNVRVVFDASQRWLLVLVDLATQEKPADGRVDWAYHYTKVGGDWPLSTRWEGAATVEEYSMVGRGPGGFGIVTPKGLVQLLTRLLDFRDRDAIAVLEYHGSGSSPAGALDFDAAERWFVAELRRNDGVMRSPVGADASLGVSVSGGIQGGVASSGVQRVLGGAVRVGGSVRPPVKVADVDPVLPDLAARNGVRGIVLLEITIGIDGTVKDARVLRSIPMLDAAALDAVRQWRYEPTTVEGKVVPVVMTVSVAF